MYPALDRVSAVRPGDAQPGCVAGHERPHVRLSRRARQGGPQLSPAAMAFVRAFGAAQPADAVAADVPPRVLVKLEQACTTG